jgi:hypothetical protein
LSPRFNASAIEAAADDVIANAREILDTATANHHGRVFLKVMAFAADVGGDFITIA